MRMTFRAAVALAVVFFFPGAAIALGISIVDVRSTGASTTRLAAGDVLTVDLVLNNDGTLPVYGIGLAVAGYDLDGNGVADDGLGYVDGVGVDSVFNEFSVPDPADPTRYLTGGGIDNVYQPPREIIGRSRETPASDLTYHGLGVSFLGAISLTPTDGDGSHDVGVDGQLVRDGDVHFRLRFRALARAVPTETTLVFGIPLDPFGNSGWGAGVVGPGGSLYEFDNDFLNVFNQTLAVRVVPEPGTALLVGFGLAVLGARRREDSAAS